MKMKTPRPELPPQPPSGDNTIRQPGQSFARRERGATSIEYVLLAALIGLAAVVILTQTGSDVTSGYENLQTKVEQA